MLATLRPDCCDRAKNGPIIWFELHSSPVIERDIEGKPVVPGPRGYGWLFFFDGKRDPLIHENLNFCPYCGAKLPKG